MLRAVPPAPVEDDDPSFGTYAGRFADTDLRLPERGVGRLRRLVSEKRWQWFGAFDDDLAVGGAIVDAGPFGNAFLWVFDRVGRELVVDADVLVPSALVDVATETHGVIAEVDLPRRRLRVTRAGDAVAITGRFAGVGLDLAVDTGGRSAATAVCPVPDRAAGVNVTQKETCAAVEGRVSMGCGSDRRLEGLGMLDYSHGLLARETAWEWAIASGETAGGRPVGFNLVAGFNDGLENAVWLDGSPRSVGEATFEIDGSRWRVRTDCGRVDATLHLEGRRREDVDAGLVASSYDQPIGRWSGSVCGHDVDCVGVAERHRALW